MKSRFINFSKLAFFQENNENRSFEDIIKVVCYMLERCASTFKSNFSLMLG